MPAHSKGFWSSALRATGPSRLVRLSAAMVVVLLAVGAGGAVGLSGSGQSKPTGAIGVGQSPATSPMHAPGGRSSTSPTSTRMAGSTTSRPSVQTSTTLGAADGAGSGATTTVPGSGAGRGTTGGSTTQPQQLPPPGSYSYRTSGSQTVSAFGGNFTSGYPSPTQIDVARSGCGETDTWSSSSNSSSETYVCPVTGGLRIYYQQSTEYGQTQRFNCAPNAFIPVTTGTVGQQWRFSCTSSPPGTTSDQTVTFKGVADKTVGSQTVRTVEVEVDSVLSGNDSGTATTHYWFTSDAGLVEETGSIDVTSHNPSGKYTANYALDLISLRPS